jgi:galactokinase
MDRAPKGASALCCSSVPLGGGLVGSAGFGAPFYFGTSP